MPGEAAPSKPGGVVPIHNATRGPVWYVALMHAIALIPGFLGFDHAGQVTYFADRFIAGLRAAVEALVGTSVLVAPVNVSAIGNLADRQRGLVEELERLDRKQGGPFAWHLVGHSTGGLDAALLTRVKGLRYDPDRGSVFSDADLALVQKIASVTTIATPHYGTCLARSPLPAATRPGATAAERVEGLLALPELARDLAQRGASWERLQFARGASGTDSLRFLHHLLCCDELARDLDPKLAGGLTSTQNARQDVPIFSIATMSPPPSPLAAGTREDHLFRDLWTWTQLHAEGAEPAPPPVSAAAASQRIQAVPGNLPIEGVIDARTNDGVVNTNRQVFGEFAGLVFGDHGDVIGRYRRRDPLDHGLLDPGLLTSGASFDDDQFFELLRLVARGITRTIGSPAAGLSSTGAGG